MNKTRSINKIYVDDSFFQNPDLLNYGRTLRAELIEEFADDKQALIDELDKIYKNGEWIKISDMDMYYVKSQNLLFPDIKKIEFTMCDKKMKRDFCGFKGDLISYSEVKDLFIDKYKKNPFSKDNDCYEYLENNKINSSEYIRYCSDNRSESASMYLYNGYSECNQTNIYDHKCSYCYNDKCLQIPVHRLKSLSFFKNCVDNGIVPEKLGPVFAIVLKRLIKLKKFNCIEINDNNEIIPTVKFLKEGEPEVSDVFSDNFVRKMLKKYAVSNTLKLNEDFIKAIGEQYLECDKKRADIESYDLGCLTDINGGHWDLWKEECPKDKTAITIEPPLVGRNPEADIRWDGLVGIDFGTRSTVVSYQDGSDKTHLLRIGKGKLNERVKQQDYENPTVMEFIDLDAFIQKYSSADGRPETEWNDLTVSHTAQNNFKENVSSDKFFSFFYDLKQWCGDTSSKRQIKIKDNKNYTICLPEYINITDDGFDPIEIYAYYLGLYINNMRNGIFLDYIMSFPVTYEKSVREHIVKSFERGLKKSLPEEILNDKEIISKFRVKAGASEPACYAICALQQFGIEPNEKPVFYGIFDFGGGTTDFDFGIWRYADEDKPSEEDYDYVIEHFGAGGDKYLGGENLLELLSYEVFIKNLDVMLKGNFQFFKPAECESFDGHESVVTESQEARNNTKSLMEKLRPFVEGLSNINKTADRSDKIISERVVKKEQNADITDFILVDAIAKKKQTANKMAVSCEDGSDNKDRISNKAETFFKDGKIKLNLIDGDGKMKTDQELQVNENELIAVLKNRIESGVMNFFHSLKKSYDERKDTGIDKINIFLAGNSSRSPIVSELFEKYMSDFGGELQEKDLIILYPPLGTKESDELQKNLNINAKFSDSVTRPTCKTGVAYGLLEGRSGSNILVKSEINSSDEIPFRYYIGINKKKKFKTILAKGTEYNKWIRFKNAMSTDFYIYYSSLPIVESDAADIEEIRKKKCVLPQAYSEEYSVYIRAVKPNVIEYAVTNEELLGNNQYEVTPQTVELSE